MNFQLKYVVLITSSLLLSVAVPSLSKTGETLISQAFAQTQTSDNRKVEADKLFQEGVQQYRRGEYPKALQIYQRVLEMRRQLGDKAGEAATLNNLGEVYYWMRQHNKALEVLQPALVIRQQLKDKVGEGETLDNIGLTYYGKQEDNKALEVLQQALIIRREVKDQAGEGKTLSNLGALYVYLPEQSAKALDTLQQALTIQQKVGDQFQAGITLRRIGGIYSQKKDYTRALEWSEKALAISRQVQNRAGEGESLELIGTVYSNQKNDEQAIKFYQEALPLIREAGISSIEEKILASIGNAFNNLKQYNQNIAFYQQELANARKSNNKSLQGNILKWIGNTYFKQENYDRALEFFQQALVFVPEVKDKSFKANIIAGIGDCYFRKKEYQQAINFYQQAILAAREADDTNLEGIILNQIGNSYFLQEQYDSALKFYQQALLLVRKAKNESLEIQIITDIADTYSNQKQHDRAIDFYQQELQTAQKADKKLLQGNILLFIGNAYFDKDDKARALEFYQQALPIFKAVNAQDMQLKTLTLTMRSHYSIASSAKDKKDYTLAINEANKVITLAPEALTIARKLKQNSDEKEVSRIQSRAYSLIGSIHQNLGDLKKAQEFAEQGLKIAQQSENLEAENFALSVLAGVYQSLGNQTKIIELTQRQLEIAQKLQKPISEVQALLNIAASNNILGNYQKAIELLEQALNKIEAVDIKKLPEDDQANAWETKYLVFWNLSGSYLALGEYDKALKFAQQRLDLAETLKKPELEAPALIDLGDVYTARQEFDQAVKLTQQALDIAKQIKNPEIEVDALKQLGKIYVARGNYSQATEIANLLLETADKTKNIKLKLDALNIFKDIYAAQGNLQKVLEILQQSLTIAKQDTNPSSEFWALVDQATFYISPVVDYQKALDLSQQANSTAKKLQNPQLEGTSLFLLAFVHFAKGEPQKTIELANQGLAISQKTKMIWLEMLANAVLSFGYGDLDNDQKAMESAQALLALTRKAQSPTNEKTALTILGNIHRKFGRKQDAINTYKQALAVKVSAKAVGDDSGIYAGLGRTYADLNQPEEAIKNFREAFIRAEEVRRGFQGLAPDLQASFWKQISDFDSVKTVDIYRQYADLLFKQGRTAEAQQVLDLINVRDLIEERTQARNNSLIALGLKLQECDEQKKCSPSERSQLLDQRDAINTQYNEDLKAIEEEIRDRIGKDDSAFDIRIKSKAIEIVEAEPGKVTVMISPFVLEDKMWLLLTAPGGVHKAVEVKVSREELGKAVKEFRDLMKYCEQLNVTCTSADIPKIQQASQKLYNLLIKPLEPELTANPQIKNLVFALDRVVRYVPMSALYDGKQYLIEKYSVHNLLSTSLTDVNKPNLKATKDTQVLAMGVSDSVAGSEPLPSVPTEIDNIFKMYSGLKFLNQQFDFKTLRDNLAGKQILHLATHGEFIYRDKKAKIYESYILSGAGKLSISEIQKLRELGKIHLVVLSACRTALADSLTQDGIEINSMAYEFMKEGAKAVIASLWLVDDASTAQLMQEFYKNLATGKTKSEALRQAQLSLLHANKANKDNDSQRGGIEARPKPGVSPRNQDNAKNYAHPYYWSPFILMGNGR